MGKVERLAREAALAEKSDAICRMGSLMLRAGTGSYRVKAAMGRVAEALGVEQLDAQVSLTEIVVTVKECGAFRTQVVEVAAPTVNAERIAALLRLSLEVEPGLTALQLHGRLREVEAMGRPHAAVWVVLCAALACGAFAVLSHGRWQECVAAAVAAGVGKFVQLLLGRVRVNQLVVFGVAATVACQVYVALACGMQWVFAGTVHPVHESAFTSAMLFLVPGFALLTAALDLARFDFTSGVSRGLYAVLLTLAASLGAWLVAWAYGVTPSDLPTPDLPVWMLVGIRLVAGFVGVLGFAVTFHTPLRVGVVAAGSGSVANLGRLVAVDAGWNPLLCAVAATLVVGLCAAWASQRLPAPRIILSVPAVLIMLPGAATFRALVAVIDNDPLTAVANFSASVGVVVALVAGLVVARMLTDPAWLLSEPHWTHMPHTLAQDLVRAEVDHQGVAGKVVKPPA